jgi:hypothetical protein
VIKLYYGFEIEMKGIPDQYKKELEALIWDFIWEGKVNQIKRDICCLEPIEIAFVLL